MARRKRPDEHRRYWQDALERHAPQAEVTALRAQNETLLRALAGSRREPLRPAFRSPVLLLAIPGLAAQFRGNVPDSHRILPPRGPGTVDLRCRCEALVVVTEGEFEGCECGRWFTLIDDVIRVARVAAD